MLHVDYFRLYELRGNGVKSMTGGKLYFKLKAKRVNYKRDRKLHQIDWRKLVVNQHMVEEVRPSAVMNPILTRKKATPLEIIGEVDEHHVDSKC